MKIKYSKAYKAQLKEDLLEKHHTLYGKKQWWPLATLAPLVVLVLVINMIVAPNGNLFLEKAYANSLELLAQSRNMIVYEENRILGDGVSWIEKQWMAPNGDELIIKESDFSGTTVSLVLESKGKAFSSEMGDFLQPVFLDKKSELSVLKNINSTYYGDIAESEAYTEATIFLDDVNFFEIADLIKWLEENLDTELVKYEGKEGDYEVFSLTEPQLTPEVQKIKESTGGQISKYYFNAETYALEKIDYGTSSLEIEMKLIDLNQYESIFDPNVYGLVETELLNW